MIEHRPPSESFDFKLGDLTQNFQDKLAQAVGHYSVPLVVDLGEEYKFVGSGTLICFGNAYGILTAEHVVNYAADEKYALNTKLGSLQKLRIPVAGFPHDISIDVPFLEILTMDVRKSDYNGPDLAFIKIPVGPLLNELKARKSFINIGVQAEERFNMANADSGCIVVAGFAEVDRVRLEKESKVLGFVVQEGLKGTGFVTGVESQEEVGDYDYLGLGVLYEVGGKVPLKFGGVSGGGVWRVPVKRKKDEPAGAEYFDSFYLAGVVFFQEEIIDNKCRLRAHGPKSLYKRFFPKISERFKCG